MGRYRRTVSFPNPLSPQMRPGGSASKSYHVRSVSLPCYRLHPLIPQLQEELVGLQAWEWAQSGPCSRVVDGLTRLKGVLDSLDDVLQLPMTQDSFSSKTNVVEKLLEDFLRFVDVFGIFRASMLGLKEEVTSAQVVLRRKDDLKLTLYLKAQKKIASDIGKLISTIPVPSSNGTTNNVLNSDSDDELGYVIRDVYRATMSVSETVLRAITGSFGLCRRPIWASFGLGKKVRKDDQAMIEEFQKVIGRVESLVELKKNNCKGEKKKNEEEVMRMGVLKAMQELDNCIGELEKGSERVFRSLISTRVSLLNILTHA